MAKKMLIDATHPEETRVVVVDGNKVDDFDFESINKRQLAGNIYLAKVTRVEPSLQAAFVEYGGNRHGFLAFSEIHPDYYQIPVADREALLAEEAAEAEERRKREEDGDAADAKPAKSRRRRKESKKTKPAEAAETVAGLEVIDIGSEDVVADEMSAEPDGPRGLEIAEPDGEDPLDDASPLTSIDLTADDQETVEVAEVIETTTNEDGAAIEPVETVVAEADVEDLLAADAPIEDIAPPAEEPEASADEDLNAEPEGDTPPEDDPSAPPKTIAESAGLDDEDRVTGELTQSFWGALKDRLQGVCRLQVLHSNLHLPRLRVL
ncbi:MAG: hypothetical protein AAF557_27935, partial [Pseudomonadota bacterium]